MLTKPRNYEHDIIQKQSERAINIFMYIFIR